MGRVSNNKKRRSALERYGAFRKTIQPKLKAENPTYHHKDLQKEVSRLWKMKSDEEKKRKENFTYIMFSNAFFYKCRLMFIHHVVVAMNTLFAGL